MKKNNKKGFTLAELLIVVAIIAVLVAVAIPVFGASLNRAKSAADLANVRAAYAEQLANAMAEGTVDSSGLIPVSFSSDVAENGATVAAAGNSITVTLTVNGTDYAGSFSTDPDVSVLIG